MPELGLDLDRLVAVLYDHYSQPSSVPSISANTGGGHGA